MTTLFEERISFACALAERLLAAGRLDTGAVELLESGLRTGHSSEYRPPDPRQQPGQYYPGLTATPWHDPGGFAWVPELEAAFPAIRDEALALLEAGRFAADPVNGNLTEGSWQEVRLYSEGHRVGVNCSHAPRTAEAAGTILGATTAGLVFFSVLAPGTRVHPHCGPHNARLRCHLGLVVPDGCGLRVGGQTGTWEEGKVIVFDDSFEHEVWNNSTASRIVLIIDIWHPDLTPAQIAAIRFGTQPITEIAYQIAADWHRNGVVPRLRSPRTNG